jgi:hypothetical protein
VSVNGRATHALPRDGTEDGRCTYTYPVVPLALRELVNGWNAFQWAVDAGTTFWGHALVDQACLRFALTNGHPALTALGLENFTAELAVQELTGTGEGFDLQLNIPGALAERIARVDFQGWYSGFDENGDGHEMDWHGFTRDREPMAFVGSATNAPFRVAWDTSMLPAQKNVAVRAFVRFREGGLVYVTAAKPGVVIPERAGASVALYLPPDAPAEFWSRAGRLKTCSFVLDVPPERIHRAELVVRTWTGGAGEVKEYFKLNGRHFPVAEGSRHIVQFNRLPVEPSLLRRGTNTIELLSDTHHHGIEVLHPGPALMVRFAR